MGRRHAGRTGGGIKRPGHRPPPLLHPPEQEHPAAHGPRHPRGAARVGEGAQPTGGGEETHRPPSSGVVRWPQARRAGVDGRASAAEPRRGSSLHCSRRASRVVSRFTWAALPTGPYKNRLCARLSRPINWAAGVGP